MTLSICIPIYNYNVTRLIHELSTQASQLSCPYEIILMEDGSQSFLSDNALLAELPHVQHIELPYNIGRSAIRNKLADTAQYEFLLFMDCDTLPLSSHFIQNYLTAAQSSNADVILGGCHYLKERPDTAHLLRWLYGIQREMGNATERNRHPFRSFTAFNLLIKKSVFEKVRFDESLKEYGHEDTLFGWELEKAHFHLLHIDNPAIHQIDEEENNNFLQKTNSSLKNLWVVYQKIEDKDDFRKDIKILKYQEFLRKTRLLRPTSVLLSLFSKLFRRNLTSSHPQMFIFDLYKLEVLCRASLNKI